MSAADGDAPLGIVEDLQHAAQWRIDPPREQLEHHALAGLCCKAVKVDVTRLVDPSVDHPVQFGRLGLFPGIVRLGLRLLRLVADDKSPRSADAILAHDAYVTHGWPNIGRNGDGKLSPFTLLGTDPPVGKPQCGQFIQVGPLDRDAYRLSCLKPAREYVTEDRAGKLRGSSIPTASRQLARPTVRMGPQARRMFTRMLCTRSSPCQPAEVRAHYLGIMRRGKAFKWCNQPCRCSKAII